MFVGHVSFAGDPLQLRYPFNRGAAVVSHLRHIRKRTCKGTAHLRQVRRGRALAEATRLSFPDGRSKRSTSGRRGCFYHRARTGARVAGGVAAGSPKFPGQPRSEKGRSLLSMGGGAIAPPRCTEAANPRTPLGRVLSRDDG